jgi:hypothetical protein
MRTSGIDLYPFGSALSYPTRPLKFPGSVVDTITWSLNELDCCSPQLKARLVSNVLHDDDLGCSHLLLKIGHT